MSCPHARCTWPGEALIAAIPGVVIGVLEQDELQLGAGEGPKSHLGRGGNLPLEDGPRGLFDFTGPVQPGQVGLDCRAVRRPRCAAHRRQVHGEEHVAVAALPGAHCVATDGVHVDVDGEQVVAALGAMGQDVVEERRCPPTVLLCPLVSRSVPAAVLP